MAPLPTALDVLPGHNLRGKYAIVTGGSSGLGFETVRALALRGANVILAARNVVEGEKCVNKIQAEGCKGTIAVKWLDLADLRSIERFADDITKKIPHLDFLICNAGVMAVSPKQLTQHGFEMQMATNHIGHQALCQQLIPFISRRPQGTSSRGKIVILTSLSHKWGRLDVNDLHYEHHRYNPWAAYANSKLACMLLARELARRFKSNNTPVDVYAVHPGIILTNITRNKNSSCLRACLSPIMTAMIRPFSRTAEQGAATTVYACIATGIESGSFLENCSVAEAAPIGQNDQLAKALYIKTESMINDVLKGKTQTSALNNKNSSGNSNSNGNRGHAGGSSNAQVGSVQLAANSSEDSKV